MFLEFTDLKGCSVYLNSNYIVGFEFLENHTAVTMTTGDRIYIVETRDEIMSVLRFNFPNINIETK